MTNRIFIKDNYQFGEIQRTDILGFSGSIALMKDDGLVELFAGKRKNDVIVDIVTGKDGNGDDYIVPEDVKNFGTPVLNSIGITDENDQVALFQKYAVLSETDRKENLELWEQNSGDETNRNIFLTNLLTLLADDHLYLRTQSDLWISYIREDIRVQMMTNFFLGTNEEQRKDFIVEFTAIKNDKRKREEFLQVLFKMLLDEDTYLRIELEKYAKKYYVDPILSDKIDSFFLNTTNQQRTDIVSYWRLHKLFISKKGPLFAKKQIDKYA